MAQWYPTYEEVCGHLLYTLFMAKMIAGTSMSNTFLLKTIKIEINYCVPPTSHWFSNFPDVIHVDQLSASTMMLEEAQFIEMLVRQNGLNQPGVANPPYILYWAFQGHVINCIITRDT